MAIISTMLTPLQQNKKKIEEGGDDGSGSELIIQEFFLFLFPLFYHSSKASLSVPRTVPLLLRLPSSSPLDKCYCVSPLPATKAMWFVVDFTSGSIPYCASSICQQHRHLHSV
ncbi:hypothetical protein ABZX51_005048 [Aspergillus tubingensis]